MPRQQENLQRARQLDQNVHPTDSSNPARRITRPPRQPALFPSLMAFIREKGAEFYALPLWKKLICGIAILLGLFFWHMFGHMIDEKAHCTSEWILDTTAPYHTTNQLCAFADKSVENFSSPAMYKGVESYSYGTVKLDLQYFDPEVTNGCCHHRHLYYTPLELHYTQYVPERANTISVSQLLQYHDGETIANQAMLKTSNSRDLGLLMNNATVVWAQDVDGHYVVKARSKRYWLPNAKERSIFKASGN